MKGSLYPVIGVRLIDRGYSIGIVEASGRHGLWFWRFVPWRRYRSGG